MACTTTEAYQKQRNLTTPCFKGDGMDKEAGVKFQDPLNDPLPAAPSLKMFCVYGVGSPTERRARPVLNRLYVKADFFTFDGLKFVFLGRLSCNSAV